MGRIVSYLFFTSLLLASAVGTRAQSVADTGLRNATLAGCVQYALAHQPLIQQSLLDEEITEKQIQTRLADWYPQLNLSYNLQHSFELPTALVGGSYVRTGATNASNVGFNLTQNLFNKDALFASRTKDDYRKRASQNTSLNKIDIAVSVSKAFFDVLLSQKQLSVLEQAITRLQRSLKDAVSQYRSGVVDKTDYKRATIALNNTKAQHKQSTELVVAKLSYLKQLMGLSDSSWLDLYYDTSQLEKDVFLDTTMHVRAENRMEYVQLQTQQRLQEATVRYYQWSYVPSVSAFGNYNIGYLNDEFFKTYTNSFPNSNAGITLAMPIFQGKKRIHQVKQAQLELKRLGWEMIALRQRVNTQFDLALSVYKSNVYNFYSLKENVELADDVYKTLDLQYRSGIRPYLDVITAESDLRSAQLNLYSALFQVIQSKLEVEKALGLIQY